MKLITLKNRKLRQTTRRKVLNRLYGKLSIYNKNIYLENETGIRFNDELELHNDVFIGNCTNIILPKKFNIDGSFSLYDSVDIVIPNQLFVTNSFKILGLNFNTFFLTNRSLMGDLVVSCSNIEILPENLFIKKNFFLYNNINLCKLPNNLTVLGSLHISNCQISNLPNNLYVGGDIIVEKTPLSLKYSINELNQLIKK